MPDPTKKTISATEASALFNANPYLTYWMLYHKFKGNYTPPAGDDDGRMMWGKKMQPLVVEQVAKEKKLEVNANTKETYFRRGHLGATRDATILCPDRGPGALEIKCVFDYKVWMTKWQGGQYVPKEYEIQLQTQMYVGDGAAPSPKPYTWGLIAVWVCADMHYFERKPISDLWDSLSQQASDFFDRIAASRDPDPFGVAIEIPVMNRLFQPVKEKVLDLSKEYAHIGTATQVSDYKKFDADWRFSQLAAEKIKATLLGLAKDNETVLLPHGINFRIRRSGKGRVIVPYVPDVLQPGPHPPLGGGII